MTIRLFALNGSRELGAAIARSAGVELHPLEERDFADGEHKSRPLVSVREEDVYIVHSLAGTDGRSAAERLLRLLFFIGTCRDNGAARVTAVVPYLAYARKDQQTQPRDPVNTRYVAELFEAVGVSTVVTLEPHNPAAFQNAFRCRTLHLDLRQALAARVAEVAGAAPVVFVTPDSGGLKRTQRLRETWEALTGRQAGFAMMEKHRAAGVLSGDLFAGDVAGAHAVIVDDMVASGGTMLRTALACRQRGAAAVYGVATHALFLPDPAALFAADSPIDRVIVSDSIRHEQLPKGTAGRLDIVGCAPMLGEAIQRLHAGGSISRLLNPPRP